MTSLKSGEIAILKNMTPEFARLEGEEATVKRICSAGERFNIAGQRGTAMDDGYVVDVRRFGMAWVRHDQLRKPGEAAQVEAIATDLFKRLTDSSREAV